jgi:hypothetical protein
MTRIVPVLAVTFVACAGASASRGESLDRAQSADLRAGEPVVDPHGPAQDPTEPVIAEYVPLAALRFDCSPEALAGAHTSALRLYRNAVFARHGGSFESADLQAAFGSVEGYTPDPTFTADRLSDDDLACVARIAELETGGAPAAPVAVDLDGDGEADAIAWDGTTLSVGEATVRLRSEPAERGAVQAPVWIDLDVGDGLRELLVTTDPGIEDELEFQVVRFHGGQLVPLLPEPAWLAHPGLQVGHRTLTHEATNCGQTTTTTWRLEDDQLVSIETTIGTYQPGLCAG